MSDSQQLQLFEPVADVAVQSSAETAPTPNGASNGNGLAVGQRRKKGKEPLSNRQQISSIIKSVRDLLRKDAGLAGDADRLPQLTWLLFLKCIDDFEQTQVAIYGEEDYTYKIEKQFRWKSWVENESVRDRATGSQLIEFVNTELFPYLANLSGSGNDLRNIIATIFQGISNRIRSGFILRDVINKLNEINFNSTEDIHAISHFYETMLREMRDASGDSGEFYTPRPIVRFIINRLDPKPGQSVLDPSCGTAGFLVEAYKHQRDHIKKASDLEQLYKDLIGYEKKSMPYLLATMNLLLHGVEQPNITEQNTLAQDMNNIRDEDRVDIIATNPPFGAAEEEGILKNFPRSLQTSETSLLFFQYIMAKLKQPSGLCGVVLPDGFLFGGGVNITIRKMLLTQFNLHTIIKLPPGAFAPYTDIITNILFFEACEQIGFTTNESLCTKEIWYYEIPLPKGRKKYSKTKPMQFEEFADCIAWWNKRVENEHAWKVPVEEILANDYNLDRKNPNGQKEIEHRSPEELVESILEKERRIVEIVEGIKLMLEKEY